MLQSPKSQPQRQRRLTMASVNPVLEAKQDSKCRISRQSPPPTRTPWVQRTGSRRQTHRRQYSVPDNVLMTVTEPAGSHNANVNIYPAPVQNTVHLNAPNANDEQQRHLANAGPNANNSQYLQVPTPQKRRMPRTPPTVGVPKFYPTTPESPFINTPRPQSMSQSLDDLLFEPSPVGIQRRASDTDIMTSPIRAHFDLGLTSQAVFKQQSFTASNPADLPTPPNSAALQSVSTFDLAPIPHPHFVNMAALAMPSESDVEAESYYSSSPDSPRMPSFPPSPELTSYTFENGMETVMEAAPAPMHTSSSMPMIAVPPLPHGIEMIGEPARVETAPVPLGSKFTGISIEEINQFISGPEQVDGKWVCLFPECNKRFGRKENIKSHVQTHLGDRQYRCEHCRKCFVRQHDLKRHAKIHTGIKPYPCLCGRSFARHDALTRHRQRGVCIGAFEGIVKKVAKRGRPRKRPLPEDEENGAGKGKDDHKEKPKRSRETRRNSESSSQESTGSFSSTSSYSQSEASGPRSSSPAFEFYSSPPPSLPDVDDQASSSSAPSVKEGSPELPMDTPPTSPPEFYSFEDLVNQPPDRNDGCEAYSDVPRYTADLYPDSGKSFGSTYCSSDDYLSSAEPSQDNFIFSQDSGDILGLTVLERDPNILNFDEMFVKPEMLSQRA